MKEKIYALEYHAEGGTVAESEDAQVSIDRLFDGGSEETQRLTLEDGLVLVCARGDRGIRGTLANLRFRPIDGEMQPRAVDGDAVLCRTDGDGNFIAVEEDDPARLAELTLASGHRHRNNICSDAAAGGRSARTLRHAGRERSARQEPRSGDAGRKHACLSGTKQNASIEAAAAAQDGAASNPLS